MASIVDALYHIKYNPFKFGSYIASFYSAVEDVENNILLAPLVIPLCSHPELSGKLFRSNKNSSIWTIFSERETLYDLQERINSFQELTDQSIQYCLVNDWLTVDSSTLTLYSSAEEDNLPELQKSAVKLGRLLSRHSIVEIYAFLGVRPQ